MKKGTFWKIFFNGGLSEKNIGNPKHGMLYFWDSPIKNRKTKQVHVHGKVNNGMTYDAGKHYYNNFNILLYAEWIPTHLLRVI